MDELVDVACPNCGWRDRRTKAALDRDKSVACPRCFSLHSIEKAVAAGQPELGDFTVDFDDPEDVD